MTTTTAPRPEKLLYPPQNPIELGDYYMRHVGAMTTEGLHSKADIAEQLAWRDRRIDQLEALAASEPSDLADGDASLAHELSRHIQVAGISQDGVTLYMRMDQSLASVGLEGTDDSGPYKLTFTTMTREQFDALGDFNGF